VKTARPFDRLRVTRERIQGFEGLGENSETLRQAQGDTKKDSSGQGFEGSWIQGNIPYYHREAITVTPPNLPLPQGEADKCSP